MPSFVSDTIEAVSLCTALIDLDRLSQLFCFQRTTVLELYLSIVPLSRGKVYVVVL